MVRNGQIEVFDNQDKLLLEGQTDEKGTFAFQTPAITDLTIVLTAGMGHRSTWRLSAAELGGETSVKAEASTLEPAPAAVNAHGKSAATETEPGLTAADVEKIVARQLEARLQPLTRMIAASQDQGPSLSDILGGVGYIIGLVGLSAYLRYRKERSNR
jgi:nickel transport protein